MIFKRLTASPLFWYIVSLTIWVIFNIALFLYLIDSSLSLRSLAGLGIILGVGFGWIILFLGSYYFRKRLFYEFSLPTNVIRNVVAKDKWPWWNRITPHIILGALPLKNKDDLNKLLYNEKISAVLTLLQPFEWESQGVLSIPVTPEDWNEHKIHNLQILVKDLAPLSLDQIDQGVSFIHKQVSQGNTVYVHCKAGRGRSAAIVICYLIKHDSQLSVDDAIEFLKQKRPQIAINQDQKSAIENYKIEIIKIYSKDEIEK